MQSSIVMFKKPILKLRWIAHGSSHFKGRMLCLMLDLGQNFGYIIYLDTHTPYMGIHIKFIA